MNFLYRDNHIIVCNKSIGFLTQTNGLEESLECQVREAIKIMDNKPGNVFVHALHRLDKPVSGIVVFAKTGKALSRMQSFQREGQFKKTYYACVLGTVRKNHDILKHHLVKESFIARKARLNEKGRLSILEYDVISRSSKFTLLKIVLHTGFYHQIRLQMKIIGHPIVGDAKYGITQSFSELFLHHGQFECPHPISQKTLLFKVPVPIHWKKLLIDFPNLIQDTYQELDIFSI